MNKWVKIGLGVIGGGISLVLMAGIGVYAASSMKLNKKVTGVHTMDFKAPDRPAAVTKGEHLYRSLAACADCHGEDGTGKVVVPGGPMGTVTGANLTLAMQKYSDPELERIIRHGVRPDDSTIKFMPVFDYVLLSDQEIGQLIAYMRTLPQKGSPQPAPTFGPIGRMLLLADAAPVVAPALYIDHDKPHLSKGPPPGPTAEYGEYRSSGCIGCHGHDLNGGPIPGGPPDWPPARNITLHETGIKGWKKKDFYRVLREGKRPDGTPVRMPMPIEATKLMTDDEIDALWAYIQTVPPTPLGSGEH